MIEKLKNLYQQLSELTNPMCGKCAHSYGCCSKEYCELVEDRAKELGVTIPEKTNNPIPYMGGNGCVVPPYLRPICTMHTCDINSLGFVRDYSSTGLKPDKEKTTEYFRLRKEIEELELQLIKNDD